jgi:hypothetical protein
MTERVERLGASGRRTVQGGPGNAFQEPAIAAEMRAGE